LQEGKKDLGGDFLDPKCGVDQRGLGIRTNFTNWFATLKEGDIVGAACGIDGTYRKMRIAIVAVEDGRSCWQRWPPWGASCLASTPPSSTGGL
jgi:hypothetical protein